MIQTRMQRLRVNDGGRFLEKEDGTPFFWLGDTAWELFHKLNREEAEHYLRTRAEQGFNVVQAVALAEFEGVTTGNAYGRLPLLADSSGLPDPSRPDLAGPNGYWDHIDFVLDTAAAYGIYIALLPTWGDKFNKLWGKGPEIFSPENARTYGRWLGARYQHRPNLVWVLGGDRPLQTSRHFAIVEAMAEGLTEGDGGAHLRTFHPKGAESSSHHLHDADWLDFNMIQSGHGEAAIANDLRVAADYARLPVKPTLDSEPCYEDIPIGFDAANGYFDEADARRAAYYAVLSGACGHTYGHHSVWSMAEGAYANNEMTEPGAYFLMDWKTALRRPGANQMKHVRALMETSGFASLRPDPQLLARNFPGSNRMVAARIEAGALVYCPNGLFAEIDLGRLEAAAVEASWFDPRSGEYTQAGTCEGEGVRRFDAPSSGRGNDWVLRLKEVPHA
ncbi:glycoside hydrolase family 140 protein [Cohnella thailandensis]|nr:glycoside hydrolase family 140 protein [Cohnella thailandensis]MBP1976278.1 hypothetical protein [Cohnella thailandensis]